MFVKYLRTLDVTSLNFIQEMADLAKDYRKIKAADEAIRRQEFHVASGILQKCNPTAKIKFNLAVLNLWATGDVESTKSLLKEALSLDKYLAIAAFYLGVLEVHSNEDLGFALSAFNWCLQTFRSCKHVDYTAVGMPFRLLRQHVAYNLAILYRKTNSEYSSECIEILKELSLEGIKQVMGASKDSESPVLQVPPINDRLMIFNLLPKIEPVSLELLGPEFIGQIDGPEGYSGFEDAQIRVARREKFLSKEDE